MAKVRILVVSDRTDADGELDATLARLGYEAASAASGDAAADAAAMAAPAVALIDVGRRGTDATATAAAILDVQPAAIVFTGTAGDEEQLRRAAPSWPYEFLVPPFTDRELHTTIELALCRYRAARASHEMERFFAVSIDMFCFLDMNGYFKRLNVAWERTLGFTREELMSKPFIEFVHPDDRERTLKQNAEVRAGGQAIGFENRYMCKDGSFRWLMWNAALQSAEGVIYSAARDITVRKQAEADRAQLVEELEASLAEVRELQEILPICMYCKQIRDDEDYWHTVEGYISRHTRTRFSHSICPTCMATEVEPELTKLEEE